MQTLTAAQDRGAGMGIPGLCPVGEALRIAQPIVEDLQAMAAEKWMEWLKEG
jgi:hypothetical protein